MATTTSEFVYDPSTSEFQEQIWDVYRTLRDELPVYYHPQRREYVLSRFEDVWSAVHDWETFSSVVAEAQSLLPQMIHMDPERHTQLRALVSRAFTPRRVAEVEPLTRQTARTLLDGIVPRGGVCEVQHEFAAVVPSVVVARMIGVPDEHIDAFRSWTESFLEIQGAKDFADAASRIYELFAELLAERRRAPRDDLMSALITAEVEGDRLTDDELLGFCLLLILAGNDTTSSLIGNGIVLLARQPDQRTLLLRDPTLWPGAVEEMNRIESPAQVLPRTTTRPVELHGMTIPSGSRVMLVWGAANHDDREFSDPERFDVTRHIGRHLAFGHGVHYCLGANLARLEARVAFEEWHARFPEYDLEDEPQRITSIWARGFGRVPVRLRAG
jgi:cytochrome P450